MKRSSFFTAICIFLIIVSISPITFTKDSGTDYTEKVDKVKYNDSFPKGNSQKSIYLKVDVIYPINGATLEKETCRVLVNAYAIVGISSVKLKITGPESVEWTDITQQVEETSHYYDWDPNLIGTYQITAMVVDAYGRSGLDTITVFVGEEPSYDRWAVLIGIADYQGNDNDLWHPDEDAKEMTLVLQRSGYSDDHIILLLNNEATKNAIEDAIDWLILNEKEDDEIVFFYSGHGNRLPDNEVLDGDVESDGYDEMIVTYDLKYISDGWLRDRFEEIESKKFALLFGSCHSGGMFDDNDDLQGQGRVIVSACKANQYGWDYFDLGNTLWGYYFIEQGLLYGNANSIETAHAYAYPNVISHQPDSQPQIYDEYIGEFTFTSQGTDGPNWNIPKKGR